MHNYVKKIIEEFLKEEYGAIKIKTPWSEDIFKIKEESLDRLDTLDGAITSRETGKVDGLRLSKENCSCQRTSDLNSTPALSRKLRKEKNCSGFSIGRQAMM